MTQLKSLVELEDIGSTRHRSPEFMRKIAIWLIAAVALAERVDTNAPHSLLDIRFGAPSGLTVQVKGSQPTRTSVPRRTFLPCTLAISLAPQFSPCQAGTSETQRQIGNAPRLEAAWLIVALSGACLFFPSVPQILILAS